MEFTVSDLSQTSWDGILPPAVVGPGNIYFISASSIPKAAGANRVGRRDYPCDCGAGQPHFIDLSVGRHRATWIWTGCYEHRQQKQNQHGVSAPCLPCPTGGHQAGGLGHQMAWIVGCPAVQQPALNCNPALYRLSRRLQTILWERGERRKALCSTETRELHEKWPCSSSKRVGRQARLPHDSDAQGH